MKCPMEGRDRAAWLLDYAAGRLEVEAAANLEEHLETCPACAEFARGQRAVWQALEAWEAPPAPMDFDRRLYTRIEQRVSWWDRLLAPVLRHALPAAAAAGVLIMAGLILQRPAQQVPDAPTQASAQVEALAPEQVADALDDMQMLQDFNRLVRAGNAAPRM